NYEKGVEEYSALLNAYPADASGHTNLAVAYFYLLDFASAAREGRRAVEAYPKNAAARSNLALYSMYAGDFAGGASYARGVIADLPTAYKAFLPIAVDAAVRGDLAAAVRAYDDMARTGVSGASLASTGRADLALFGGRIGAALDELKSGIDTDTEAKIPSGAA